MVKFLDIQKITASFEPTLSELVQKVVSGGWYLLGHEVESFENEYASYIGTKHCIGTANGLDALRLIFKAYIEMGVMKAGDEVIVPANTFIASVLAITDNQLNPVFVEPDLASYNLDISRIEDAITSKTKAILVVHLYGQACWSSEMERLAQKYHLKIIEDNAQAAGAIVSVNSGNASGATLVNKRTGALGDAAGHSFYPGKNLGALGDGGAVTCCDDRLASVLRSLANYGSSKKYHFDYQGLNSRLDEIQAAVLRLKLTRLDSDNQRRRDVANTYLNRIQLPQLVLPHLFEADPMSHVWHLFVIRHPQRDKLQTYLTENGIQTLIHYPVPPHKQQAYHQWNHLSLPITEKIHHEVLSLPISQVMTPDEAETVVEVLNRF